MTRRIAASPHVAAQEERGDGAATPAGTKFPTPLETLALVSPDSTLAMALDVWADDLADPA